MDNSKLIFISKKLKVKKNGIGVGEQNLNSLILLSHDHPNSKPKVQKGMDTLPSGEVTTHASQFTSIMWRPWD